MATQPAPPTPAFLTPPRILIPKLVRSRDAWKAKATRRKHQRKALLIRVRDLTASRSRHRARADRRATECADRRRQLDHSQHLLDQARLHHPAPQPRPAATPDPAAPKKKSP